MHVGSCNRANWVGTAVSRGTAKGAVIVLETKAVRRFLISPFAGSVAVAEER